MQVHIDEQVLLVHLMLCYVTGGNGCALRNHAQKPVAIHFRELPCINFNGRDIWQLMA